MSGSRERVAEWTFRGLVIALAALWVLLPVSPSAGPQAPNLQASASTTGPGVTR